MYTVAGMTDKNKDVLLKDLLDLVGSSTNQFLQGLFPDRPDPNSKKRPPTASDKIKSSANALVEKLMRSQPSYIRTIKPNQNKSPTEYDTKAILHQIKYLGLQENIRIRRAGFAYRNTFEKMVERCVLGAVSFSASRAHPSARPQVLPALAINFIRWRVHLERRCADWLREHPSRYGYRSRGVADGHHQSVHQESRDGEESLAALFGSGF